MHEGRFPAGYDTGPARARRPVALRGQDLLDDAPAVEGITRRAWLVGMGGFLCVATVSTTTILARSGRQSGEQPGNRPDQPGGGGQPEPDLGPRPTTPTASTTQARSPGATQAQSPAAMQDASHQPRGTAHGSLGWALAMRHAGAAELIKESGRLEMVSAQHRREAGLVPVFERMLEVALRREHEHWDLAGACAVRSLARLGQPGKALRHRAEIENRDAPEMQGALETVRRRLGRRR